jgi:hypothetical protein
MSAPHRVNATCTCVTLWSALLPVIVSLVQQLPALYFGLVLSLVGAPFASSFMQMAACTCSSCQWRGDRKVMRKALVTAV